jgi:hypothetical protein
MRPKPSRGRSDGGWSAQPRAHKPSQLRRLKEQLGRLPFDTLEDTACSSGLRAAINSHMALTPPLFTSSLSSVSMRRCDLNVLRVL